MTITHNPTHLPPDQAVSMSEVLWSDVIAAQVMQPQKTIAYRFGNNREFQEGQGAYATAPEIL
jgi:hypothetical protein